MTTPIWRPLALFLLVALSGFAPALSHAQSNEGIETRVREYFADAPIMAEIARCESRYRQYSGDGALHGGMGGRMVGVFQIYSDIHADYAASIGHDIYTLEGNLGYARHLYEREGTRPWNSSGSCWRNAGVVAGVVNTSVEVRINPDAITSNLSVGMESPQVAALQRRLNALGHTVATEGEGSSGNETTRFGALTRDAVRRFQCAQGIVCEGDEATTGYGFVGPKTRAALSAAQPSTLTAGANVPAPQAAPASAESEIEKLQRQIAELTARIAQLQAR